MERSGIAVRCSALLGFLLIWTELELTLYCTHILWCMSFTVVVEVARLVAVSQSVWATEIEVHLVAKRLRRVASDIEIATYPAHFRTS